MFISIFVHNIFSILYACVHYVEDISEWIRIGNNGSENVNNIFSKNVV
jgi:hypothetical protein